MTWLAQAADPAAVRQAVEEVLSRPEYREVTSGRSLLERVVDALLEAIGRTLLSLDPDGGTGSVWGAVGLLLVVVGLVALLVALLRRFRRRTTLPSVVPGPVGRDPRDWAAEAASHEAAGERRQALRCRYRETVALLAQRGLIDEVPGRTTGEYRAAVVDALPGARTSFEALTDAFERAWYGDRPVDAAALAAAMEARTATLAAAGIRTRAGAPPAAEVAT